jgi:hypothetical protein
MDGSMRINLSLIVVIATVSVTACGGNSDTDGTAGSLVEQSELQNDQQSVDQNAATGDDVLEGSGGLITPEQSTEPETADAGCSLSTNVVRYEYFCSASPRGCLTGARQFAGFPANGFIAREGRVCDFQAGVGDPIQVLVPFVADQPNIDGNLDDPSWVNSVEGGIVNNQVTRNAIDNLLTSSVPGYQDGAGYSGWSAMHDGVNLYLGVLISQEWSEQIYTDSGDEPWNDDSIEVVIDGNNSKGDEYDGFDDFHAILTGDPAANNVYISASSATGLDISYQSRIMPAYILYELSINLESAGIEIGKPFGFDVQTNDDDNGGERDVKYGWFERSGLDRSWFQPAVFGTLLLTDCADRSSCGTDQLLLP